MKNALMCRSTNRRFSGAEPEVWFRIVHITLDSQNDAPVVADREQTVEIALGPREAFENGNIGTLTHRVPAGVAVSAIAPRRGKPKPPARTPRVVESYSTPVANRFKRHDEPALQGDPSTYRTDRQKRRERTGQSHS